MADKKIFVVFGATENQDGSVINVVLSDSKTADEFKIRGITRDSSKPNAKALEARGIELTNDKYPEVEHFDFKVAVERYIREIEVPATFILPGFFMSNFPNGMLSQFPHDNHRTLALPISPETPIPCLDIAKDTGKFVKGNLTRRDSLPGKQILASMAYRTPTDIVAAFAELCPEAGKKPKFVQMPKDVYKDALFKSDMPEKAHEELYRNIAFMYEFD